VRRHAVAAIMLAAALSASAESVLMPEGEESHLYFYLHLAERDIKEERALQKILMKQGVLFCTGDSEAARENNRAGDLMLSGDYGGAVTVLERALRHAPLFVPFRYNMGLCLIHLHRLRDSMEHFKRAQAMVPEFYKIYMQTGYIYQRWNRENSAIDEFRKAVKYNPKELDAIVGIGNIYYERNQLESARKYYEAALRIDPFFPNGLLGSAKIHFKREEFTKTIVLLKSIDMVKDYDRSLHYYYAESAYRQKDYKTAAAQYAVLLTFRNDRFFLTNSSFLIEHKLELARRLAER
jgi:tetratricopeptide (TPR) repeat protein